MRKPKKKPPTIRIATKEDLPAIAEMIVDSHKDKFFDDFGETVRDDVIESFRPAVDAGTFVVAEKSGGLIGMCGFLVLPLWSNKSVKIAGTLAWWTNRDRRNAGVGELTVRMAEEIAKGLGVSKFFVTARRDSAMAIDKALGMGYKLSEAHYVKEL